MVGVIERLSLRRLLNLATTSGAGLIISALTSIGTLIPLLIFYLSDIIGECRCLVQLEDSYNSGKATVIGTG